MFPIRADHNVRANQSGLMWSFTKLCWTWNGFTKSAFYYWKKWDQPKNRELQFHCSSCTWAVHHRCYRKRVLWSLIATPIHFLSLLPLQGETSTSGTERSVPLLCSQVCSCVILFNHHKSLKYQELLRNAIHCATQLFGKHSSCCQVLFLCFGCLSLLFMYR